MGWVVLLLSVASLWTIRRRSLTDAFLYVYISSLLFFPGWARWIIPGLPDPTFAEAAILPIIVVYLVRHGRRWKHSFLDAVIFLLLLTMGVAEYVNAGYADAQNLVFDVLASGVFPYMLAKGLISTTALRVRFARRLVWSLFLVMLTTLYEFKFALNPFNLAFARFFPGQGDAWVVTFRYGFPRVAGPFGHAIENGIVMLIGFQLAFWLWDSNLWEPHFRYRLGGLKKSTTLLWAIAIELIFSFVRGPQIGTLIAYVLNWAGRGKDPKRRCWAIGTCFVLIGLPAIVWFHSYAAVGRSHAASESQQTAAYRKELADKYLQVALDHVWLGWGTSGWPQVSGMPSIDNNYLLFALRYGFIATGLFLLILLSITARTFWNGLKYATVERRTRSLSFLLSGTYAGITFALATVFLGLNVFPLFFMLTGFAEGYLMAGGDKTLGKAAMPGRAHPPLPFQFRRIVA